MVLFKSKLFTIERRIPCSLADAFVSLVQCSKRRVGSRCWVRGLPHDKPVSTIPFVMPRFWTTNGWDCSSRWGWSSPLFLGPALRLAAASRRRAGPDGWLPAAFAASIIGFGVAMFTFDGFAFIQATFVFWILISLSASFLL